MSLCGEGGAALCWELGDGTVPGDSSSRHVLAIALGGPLLARGGRGVQQRRLSSRKDRTSTPPPHRSRGEALVRLSIPNVLRCLEFFFPDRRYLCRAARGSLFFAGRKATVPHLPGGQRRPVLGWKD